MQIKNNDKVIRWQKQKNLRNFLTEFSEFLNGALAILHISKYNQSEYFIAAEFFWEKSIKFSKIYE